MSVGGAKQLLVKAFSDLSSGELQAWEGLLAANAHCRQAYLSPAFAAAVERSRPGCLVVIGLLDGQPAWFLPLQRHPKWLRYFLVFEPVGGVMSDYFGAVAHPDIRFSPEEIFAATQGRISACLFTHLDESQLARGLSGGDPRIGLRTRIGESAEEYWDDLRKRDKKLVYDTERREKKLIKEHGEIHFEWQSGDRERDLGKLIEMKRGQYSRTGKSEAPLFVPANIALLKELLNSSEKSCEGVLSVLRCGDDLVAAHFGLRCHETLHVWFPVYEQEYAAYSPGRILLKNIINDASSRGVRLLDRGEGDNQAKRDFANEEHQYYRGVWRAPSLSGQLARLAVAIHWRI